MYDMLEQSSPLIFLVLVLYLYALTSSVRVKIIFAINASVTSQAGDVGYTPHSARMFFLNMTPGFPVAITYFSFPSLSCLILFFPHIFV